MSETENKRSDDPAACMLCGNEESTVPLIPLRYQGGETFICPRCLPRLIHPERRHQD